MKKHKKIVATLCYIQKNDKTLMLLRNKKENDIHKGKYNGLGGKCEKGEDPYSCVIREVKEEAGIDIKPIYVGNLTFVNFTPGEDWEVHLFKAQDYSGEIIECNEGTLEWVDNIKILDLNIWEGDKIFLKKLLDKDGFFFARFVYNNYRLINHRFYPS